MRLNAVRARLSLWLLAARETFLLLLPLTLAGATVSLLHAVPLGEFWLHILDHLAGATSGVMGVVVCILVGVRLNGSLGSPLASPLVAIACLVNFVASLACHQVSLTEALGYQSVLEGVLAGIFSVESLLFLKPLRFSPRGFHGVLALNRATGQVAPFVASLFLTTLVFKGLHTLTGHVGSTLLRAASTLLVDHGYLASLVHVVATQLLWFVGVHGSMLLETNFDSVFAPRDVMFDPHLASIGFTNTFAHLGGCGAAMGCALALILHRRDLGLRRLGVASLIPTIFNISESIVFGAPIVLNARMLAPFVAAPVVNFVIASMCHAHDLLPLTGKVSHWTTPVFLSGYLSAGWRGVGLQALCVALSTAIYYPFIDGVAAARGEVRKSSFAQAVKVLGYPAIAAPEKVLKRTDSIGHIARTLLEDFQRDLGTPRVYQVYQPKVDRDGTIAGVEALLRWNHPEFGHVIPSAIVNIAEETSVIRQLGEWTIDRALEATVAWRAKGCRVFPISVNVSPVQLEHASLVGVVKALVEKHGLTPADLELEVTEGRSLSGDGQSLLTLQALAEAGFPLAMDDFGMGHTSLLYLQQFKVSTVKIDGSLTKTVLSSSVNADVIKTITNLGRARGVNVVAEFVDDAVQLERLKSLGVDVFQGYFFSRPISEDDFLTFAKEHAGPDAGASRHHPLPNS